MKLHRTIGLAAALVLAVGLVAGCGGESAPEGETQAAVEGCAGSAATCEKAATCGEAAAAMCGEAEAAMCAGGAETEAEKVVGGGAICAHAERGIACDPATCEYAKAPAGESTMPCGTATKDVDAGCGGCPRAKAAAKATTDLSTDQPG